ncbi:aspartyl/asparaginyl beta-hydroxylase domain-containing protein [Qipengyuania sp.]|uniref:aspartyl/asparaginyl beta-hydroxylase domain-containing protein n=1 Tax=Qipengyuania sp. TaxID=2004515 RepID=UPI003AF7B9EB
MLGFWKKRREGFDKMASDIAACCRVALRFDELDGPALIARLPQEFDNQHREGRLREKWHLLDQQGEPMPLLAQFPELASIFDAFPGKVIKAHISRISAGYALNIHRDGMREDGRRFPQFRIFNRTLRMHIILQSNDCSWIYAEKQFYRMKPGECWMLNNLKYHSALNAHSSIDRYHVVFDVEPDAETMRLLDEGEPALGFIDPALFERHWPGVAMQ